MVAAMTGDYSIYQSWSPTRSTTSGLLIQDRRIYRFGTGGLAVGYKPNGRFIMGHPILRPMKLDFPGGTSGDGRGVQPQPRRPRDVDPEATRSPPTRTAGDTGEDPGERRRRRLDSDVLATQLRGPGHYKNVQGPEASPRPSWRSA